jgi:hypothetical protein
MRKIEESDGGREKRQGSFGTRHNPSPATRRMAEIRRQIPAAWRRFREGKRGRNKRRARGFIGRSRGSI